MSEEGFPGQFDFLARQRRIAEARINRKENLAIEILADLEIEYSTLERQLHHEIELLHNYRESVLDRLVAACDIIGEIGYAQSVRGSEQDSCSSTAKV
jgi:hypothetical protein